ncbi:FAD-dependent monooxygenase [Micromonospora sp. NPDC049645]|uniref:FAD-dependent monooxygenase n=1 Tax=Micromonospora sp. NPDC049645 TaxID=3155508 RepID=UPI0034210088
MKAIIIGAGIGGLATAACLRRVGVDVEVYERAGELRPAGSALSLSINARTALRTLGIELDVERRGSVYYRLDFRTARGRRIRRIPFGHIGERLGAQNVAIHRADLQQALLEHVDTTALRLGATATGFQVDADGVRVDFAAGGVARGDVLIGADGFNSVIRRQLVGPEEAREPGYVCWLATVPFRHPTVTDGYCAHYWGRGQRFGLVDIGGGRVYWWGTKNVPDARGWDGGKDEILRAYAGWASEVRAAIAATPAAAIISVPAQDRPFLDRWGTGPVALLGDAAHPMLPSLAQGAAQAVEDAVVLARHLGDAADVDAALRGYEADRRDRVRLMVDGSFALSRVEQLDRPVASLLRNLYMRFVPRSVIDGRNVATMTFDARSSAVPDHGH